MSPSNNPPRHPVWDVFSHLLENQIRQACSLSDPTIDIDENNSADSLHQLIVYLAHGGSQKEVFGTISSYLESPQQYAVFSELCSWIFSTEGVLSTLYQPLLSQLAAAKSQDNMQGIVVRGTTCKYRPRLFGIHFTG